MLRMVLRCILVLALGSSGSCTAANGGSPTGTPTDGASGGDGDQSTDDDGDGTGGGGAGGGSIDDGASGGGASGGGAGGGGAGGGGAGGGSDGVPSDLNGGEWRSEAVSRTPGTISNGATLAFTDDGTAWVAFSEPDSAELTDQDIVTTHNGGGGWSSPEPRSSGDRQHSWASLHAAGDTVHLVWSGPDGGQLNDILYASNDGTGWSRTYNLTNDGSRSDYKPQVVAVGDGELLLVYLSSEQGGSAGVRALSLSDPSQPSSYEELYTPEGAETCFSVSATADEAGHVHFAAECGSDLVYGTKEAGGWATTLVGFGGLGGPVSPTIRVGPEGTLHLAFAATYPCGTDSCRGIFYVKGDPRSAPAVPVLPDGEKGFFPTMVVDGGGQAVIAFHRFDQEVADVYLSWSEGGERFAPPINVTPGSEAGDDWQPTSGAVNPMTGAPEFVFHSIIAGSNPLNSEVQRLRLVSDSI